ncbi:hypothetical protein [Sphingobacterium multivorum]|uniref:hypothetical protein n=1 Tax=Sphingobacterium multivorum TaxID=28454 RepID=UPI0031BA8D90
MKKTIKYSSEDYDSSVYMKLTADNEITVGVSDGEGELEYYFKSPAEVQDFIDELEKLSVKLKKRLNE